MFQVSRILVLVIAILFGFAMSAKAQCPNGQCQAAPVLSQDYFPMQAGPVQHAIQATKAADCLCKDCRCDGCLCTAARRVAVAVFHPRQTFRAVRGKRCR